MTAAERLAHIRPKLERAKEHVGDLESRVKRFCDSKPYRVAIKRDPQSRRPIYYVEKADAVPIEIALIAGDAIQNLMSTLDHLAYQIVCADTADKPPNRYWIYFPIRRTFDEYEAVKGRKMQGALPESFAAIDALKPYEGGNDLLWCLFELNNIEKHRLLLTVGSQASGVNIGPSMMRDIFKTIGTVPVVDIFLKPADTGFPLQAGFELFADLPGAEFDPKLQFRFTVAFAEPGVVEGKPLIETVHQMANLVEGIVDALTCRL